MKQGFRLLVFFVCCSFYSLAQVTDDFSDGNFSSAPAWTGDAADFFVNPSFQLQLNNTIADTSILVTAFSQASLDNTEWQVYVKQTFSPSGSNFGRVYLASDQSNLKGPLNGYFLQFGEAGSLDAIELFRQQGTTLTSVCRGTNSSIATSFTARVKVTRDNAGNWTLFADYSGGVNYVQEAAGNDVAVNSSNFLGVYCNYTVTNSTKFFYDDFYAGPVIVDNTPPTIVSASPVSSTQLDVLFNEPVETISAQTATNYSVNNGIGNPSGAVVDAGDPKLVHLTFAGSFSSQTYQLTVNGVQDLSGNSTTGATASFSWTVPGNAGYRSVVVNELMADPSPQVALPVTEYIELFNADTITFNLLGWTLSDGTSTATLSSYSLLPGTYLIICAHADTSAFSSMGAVMGVSSFPSLNNSGDSISLVNSSSQLIDVVQYDLSWYSDAVKDEGGWSLEQRNPFMPCSGGFNWSASQNSAGGTPGSVNSVFSSQPDTTAPKIQNVFPISATLLDVTFNEGMDAASLAGGGYNVSGGITVTQVQSNASGTGVQLTLSPAITPGQSYMIGFLGLTDCAGNVLNTANAYFGIGVVPGIRDIVVTEFFPDPDGTTSLPEAEFVEIFNRSNQVVSLNGLVISDGNSSATLPADNLLPGEYAIVSASANAGFYKPYGKVVTVSSLPSLNNSGDKIILRNGTGEVLHQLSYTTAWYRDAVKDDGGWTLEIIDPWNPCAGSENWRASEDPSGGTPGRQNSVNDSNPDDTAPAILKAIAISPDTVAVWFTEYLDSTVVTGATYTISSGHIVTEVIWQVNGPAYLVLSGDLSPNVIYTLTAGVFSDCAGNSTASTQTEVILPVTGEAGDLIINEVLFNPRTGGSDFVEIYNRSQNYINLQGWQLANMAGDTVSSPKVISAEPHVIRPGEFRVITKDSTNIKTEYPKSSTGSFLQISALPSYNNDEGTVVLQLPSGEVAESFTYTEEMHFSLLDDVKGVSLERIRYDVAAAENSNWHSASHNENYATPGYLNSQAAGSSGESADVHIDPRIFSPDNDGYQDVVSINYSFDQPGYVATVTVYNDRGQLVRRLADNQLLGSDGAVIWDGIRDNGEKAAVGIYIILFEAFRVDGSLLNRKIPVVVAARL